MEERLSSELLNLDWLVDRSRSEPNRDCTPPSDSDQAGRGRSKQKRGCVPKVACAGAATSRRAAPWETLTLMAASPSLRCRSIPPGRTSHSPSASLPPPDLPVIILLPAARPLSLCDPPKSVRRKRRAGGCGGWRVAFADGGGGHGWLPEFLPSRRSKGGGGGVQQRQRQDKRRSCARLDSAGAFFFCEKIRESFAASTSFGFSRRTMESK
jgi:hypothetical protein